MFWYRLPSKKVNRYNSCLAHFNLPQLLHFNITQPRAMADLKISPASPQPDGPSYLNDLPPELLRRILEFTLPQGLTFTFFYTRKGRGTRILMAKEIRMSIGGYKRAFYKSRCNSCAIGKSCDNTDRVFHLTTPLFHVNKKLSSEARGNVTLLITLTVQYCQLDKNQR